MIILMNKYRFRTRNLKLVSPPSEQHNLKHYSDMQIKKNSIRNVSLC